MKLRAGSTLSGGTSYPTPYVCDVEADWRTAVDRQPSDRAVELTTSRSMTGDMATSPMRGMRLNLQFCWVK